MMYLFSIGYNIFLMAEPDLFLLFSFFSHDKCSINLTINDKMCVGLDPGAAGWWVQTNPLSYGGTPTYNILPS